MANPTVYEILVDVGYALRDTVEGVTDTAPGGINQMRDTRRSVAANDTWVGGEALFPVTATTPPLTGTNPLPVTAFVSSGGIFTFGQSYNAGGGCPSGTAYALLNQGGRGIPYAVRLAALRNVLTDMNVDSRGKYAFALDTAAKIARGYDIDLSASGLDSVSEVWYTYAATGYNKRLRGGQPGVSEYYIDRVSKTAHLEFCPLLGYGLTFRGRVRLSSSPLTVATSLNVNRSDAVAATVEWLTTSSEDRTQLAIAGNLYAQRMRQQRLGRAANEVFFI